jgi:hypothetical protein
MEEIVIKEQLDDYLYRIQNKELGSEKSFRTLTISLTKNAESYDKDTIIQTFWLSMIYLMDNGADLCDAVSNLAFSFIGKLFHEYDGGAVKELVGFMRDDLFLLYLKNKSTYYTVLKYFYLKIHGGYPDIHKDGFRNIKNILDNTRDNGYMDADYIYSTAWLSARGKALYEKGYDVSESDYKVYKQLVEMYGEFASFANQRYGLKSYNTDKEKKLYKLSLQRPNCIEESSDDPFSKRPLWTAMAYATAEAAGEYDGRYNVASALGFAEFCDDPYPVEINKIDNRKKQKRKRIIISAIALVVIIFAALILRKHLVLLGILAFLAAFGLLESGVRGGKGSDIWYVGHYYIGPAYWFKR